MPPEKSAYALARYSRSPDSIEQSLRWVHEHSSERFWEQFYFAYGHGSIADLGHVTICFENITELAAIHIEDEPLWDGQAKSSRYHASAYADFSGGIGASAMTLARNLGHPLNDITTVNMDFIQHYRPRVNVVTRPTKPDGRGYALTGHHEIMLPLLAAALIETIGA